MRRLLLELLAAGVLGMVAGRPHQCSPRARGLNAKEDWLSGTTSKDALPSLYDIDIDTLSAGLFSHTFTSVDLTHVTHLFEWGPDMIAADHDIAVTPGLHCPHPRDQRPVETRH